MSRPKLSPAAVLACLALFFAVGGTAVAARHYLITSTGQIKPSVLKALRGKAGAPGTQGAAGAPGPPGPAGPSSVGAITDVIGPTVSVGPEEVGGAEAACPPGMRVIGGGGSGGIAGLGVSEAESGRGDWFVIVTNTTLITVSIHAEALCAPAGQAVAARVGRPPGAGPLRHRMESAMRASLAARSPMAHTACSSRYTSATVGGSHKCLHAGEYCARRYEHQYERYGYDCSTSYSPPRLRRN
jgi:hypothetical protein